MTFRNILIALDDGPVAAHAANVGSELARSLGADVALVNVTDPRLAVVPEGGIAPGDMIALAEQESRRLLASFRTRLSSPAPILEFVEVGEPAETIVKVAKDWPADVIVIGSHGRRGVQRALVGSVAESVMRHATCPVLVVRAKE